MTAAAITKPCSACKKHFIGLDSIELCPECVKDSDFYRRTRKRGDPRKFIPYSELFTQWKARRDECRDWRKRAAETSNNWLALHRAEQDRSYLLAALHTLSNDPDPVVNLAKENANLREELKRLTASATYWQARYEEAKDPEMDRAALDFMRRFNATTRPPDIPPDMRRRLIQLCHPDRHGNSEASQTATRWLLEGRQ